MVHPRAHKYAGDSIWQRAKAYIRKVDGHKGPHELARIGGGKRPKIKDRKPTIAALKPRANLLDLPPWMDQQGDPIERIRGKAPVVKRVVARKRSTPKNAKRLGIHRKKRRRG